MGARLTDQQRKRIVEDYVEIGSYNAVGKKNGVSDMTVKRIVEQMPDLLAKLEGKKAQNTADILEHMETKKECVNQIIDAYLEKLLDPVIMEKATPSQLTTALGTLIDKFTSVHVKKEALSFEDDPLTKSLMEEAERMNRGDFS